MSQRRPRRLYLDWLRGLAVLIMIEAHLIDSWTRAPDRETREFAYAMILGGFGAPLFLFLAGVAVPLSAASRLARTGSVAAATGAVARRGLEIFGLAFLFRAQSWLLSWGPNRGLLKVDILNIMGPAIALTAGLWGLSRTTRTRIVVFAAATAAVAVFTPMVRAWPGLAVLPAPLRAYIVPVPDFSNFVLLPWIGFVLAGALVGVIIDATRTTAGERSVNLAFATAGIALAFAAHRASFVPSLFPQSQYWTTSASFFLLRLGILVAAVGGAWIWEQRRGGAEKRSPLRQLGRTSLFIYWIHVEMVYGLISLPLHRSLSWLQAWASFVLFTVFMLACSIAKDRFVEWRREKRRPRVGTGEAAPV